MGDFPPRGCGLGKFCPLSFSSICGQNQFCFADLSLSSPHEEKTAKKYLKRILFVYARREVIKFPPGPLSELPANFFLDSVLGFQNYETSVYREKNNKIFIHIYTVWQRYTKNVQFNDKRESKQSSRIVEMAKVFYPYQL